MPVVYVDSSAWLKTVVAERESDAVAAWAVASGDDLVSSLLLHTELHCAVRRRADAYDAVEVQTAVDRLTLVDLVPDDLLAAARSDSRLRAADAIHLVTAIRVGAGSMLVYDAELATAAEAAGSQVIAPR